MIHECTGQHSKFRLSMSYHDCIKLWTDGIHARAGITYSQQSNKTKQKNKMIFSGTCFISFTVELCYIR